jgi:hypothetical protein
MLHSFGNIDLRANDGKFLFCPGDGDKAPREGPFGDAGVFIQSANGQGLRQNGKDKLFRSHRSSPVLGSQSERAFDEKSYILNDARNVVYEKIEDFFLLVFVDFHPYQKY